MLGFRPPKNMANRAYRLVEGACNNRSTVNIDGLTGRHDHQWVIDRLARNNIKPIEIDIVELARQQVGEGAYGLRSTLAQAPDVVDCAGFTLWLYFQLGIPLPRHTINQWRESVSISFKLGDNIARLRKGDLIFTHGRRPWTLGGRFPNGVGHVGIYSDQQSIIHAASTVRGIVEDPFEEFASTDTFRGVGRIIPHHGNWVTFSIPPELCIMRASDLLAYIHAREAVIQKE